MCRLVRVCFAGLHEEEIHQAVLVVVEPSDACAHGLEIVFLFGLCGVLEKSDSGFFADVGVADGDARVLRFRIWKSDLQGPFDAVAMLATALSARIAPHMLTRNRRLSVSGLFPIPRFSRRCPFYQQHSKKALNHSASIFSNVEALHAF